MKTTNPTPQQQTTLTNTQITSLKIRTGLRVGAWNCANCQGEVNGNQLYKPTCEYCQQA